RKERSWATIPKTRAGRAMASPPFGWPPGVGGSRWSACGRSARLQALRARSLGVAGSNAQRLLADLVARRQRLRQRSDHARSRATRGALFVRAAVDRQYQTL